jgi:O-antigen/teichoic acid export membrane protein
MVALLPRLTALIGDGRQATADQHYREFCFLISCLAGFGGFGLAFFAPEILELWLGGIELPNEIIAVTQLLGIGGLFLALGSVPFYLGLAHGHTRTAMALGLFTLFVSLPLTILLTQSFGMVGAAIPWILLNLVSFVSLYSVAALRFYQGDVRDLAIRGTAFPLVCAAVALGSARVVADVVGLAPLATCLLAALAGGLAAGLLLWRGRDAWKFG